MWLDLDIQYPDEGARLCALEVLSDLLSEIQQKQETCPTLRRIRERMSRDEAPQFMLGADGVLRRRGRVCVPADTELRQRILQEAHRSLYSVHPGTSKMYQDLRRVYWWGGLKPNVARFVAQCATCQ